MTIARIPSWPLLFAALTILVLAQQNLVDWGTAIILDRS